MLPIDEIRLNFNPGSLALLNGVLAFLMFGIALETRIDDFKRVLRMPVAFAVGIATQFLLLPAITFALTLLVQPGPSISLGMILVACCPPGNVSNILTHRAGGNVALSVSMTAVSNTISIVAMPLNLAFWGGLHPVAAPLLRSIALDPVQMLLHVLMIIGAPFALGLACTQLFPRWTERFKKPLRSISFLVLIGFIVGAIAGNWRASLDYIGLMLLIVAAHDALAFALGWGVARAARLSEYDARAMSIEVGVRNAGLGLGLVFSFFDGLGGMALVAGFWGFWDILAGMVLAAWWVRRPLKEHT